MDSLTQKRCTCGDKCVNPKGSLLSATSEYFPTYKGKNGKTYLRGKCRACKALYSKEWYRQRVKNNPEFVEQRREYDKRVKSDPVKADRRRITARKRYKLRYTTDEQFKERVQAKNRKQHATKKTNIEYVLKRRASGRSRRLLANATEGRYTKEDVVLQYKSQSGKCWHCGKSVGTTFHVDHLYPLSRGGSNNANNLVISCPDCNLSKHDKTMWEWAGRLL
jgi:5-methylcytosine-specific restriction endonuclease McrA